MQEIAADSSASRSASLTAADRLNASTRRAIAVSRDKAVQFVGERSEHEVVIWFYAQVGGCLSDDLNDRVVDFRF